MMFGDVGLGDACRAVAGVAVAGGWRVGVAESCTGGVVAASLTALAGASGFFSFGVVSYANFAKMDILRVPSSVLQRYGAVSEQTAAAMCEGAMTLFPENDDGKLITIAITGIAGPGGGDDKKPVGTVCMGWLTNHNDIPLTETCLFRGDRESVRLQSAVYALQKAVVVMGGG